MKYLSCLCLFSALLFAETPKPLVFVVDHDTYEVSQVGESMQGGVRPAHSEQVKNLVRGCPAVTITADRESADYVVDWTLKTWQQTSWGGHQNEFTVYDRKGTAIGAGEAHRATAAAKDICKIVVNVQR